MNYVFFPTYWTYGDCLHWLDERQMDTEYLVPYPMAGRELAWTLHF
jgi:hypothetical protein